MRIGIVGAGAMGRVHSAKYRQMGDVEVHAFDYDPLRAAEIGESHPSLESLIESSDAIDICVPNDQHFSVGQLSLASRRPTLMEKPLARTVAEGEALDNLAQERGVLLMCGHVVRFFPEHEKAHRMLKDGAVGRLASVRMKRLGKAPAGNRAWFLEPDRSGGVLLDLAIHDFDWLLWTVGPVTQVMARSVRLGQTVPGADFVGDHAVCTLSHESGVVSHVEASWMEPAGFRTQIEAAGSEGVLEFDSRQNPAVRVSLESGQRAESHFAPSDDPYFRQLTLFVNAVKEKSPSPIPASEGLAALRVAEAAIQSAESGQPVFLV